MVGMGIAPIHVGPSRLEIGAEFTIIAVQEQAAPHRVSDHRMFVSDVHNVRTPIDPQ